ncbi:DUF6248 family natural product biosynthesis protein [Streptomyces sp. NPDC059142]|uniref:DUF6248 family natural product biosynthesis protein n=1 Tax=Streptomyces sp. NPDC059142 TaxID=3346739 RepID=UPI0036C84D84
MNDITGAVIRRPQRTLTRDEREMIRDIRALNFQAALLMGIVDPVPGVSPMSEDEGAWVREQVWPAYLTDLDRKYPFGFHRWAMCERGTCWNCLNDRCDLCVHRQRGGPHVDDNIEWVHGSRGRTVAKFIVRPDDAPCVWWCRCSCPKDGPLPAGTAASAEAGSAPAQTGAERRPDGAEDRGGRRGAPVGESAGGEQATLF